MYWDDDKRSNEPEFAAGQVVSSWASLLTQGSRHGLVSDGLAFPLGEQKDARAYGLVSPVEGGDRREKARQTNQLPPLLLDGQFREIVVL